MDSEDSNSVGPVCLFYCLLSRLKSLTQRVIQIPLALVEAKMVSILLPLDRAYAWLQGDVRQRQLKLNERVQRERVMRSRPGVPPPSLFNPLPRVEAPAAGAGLRPRPFPGWPAEAAEGSLKVRRSS